jgi:molybdenum cofactor cytidylyltransferase
MSIAIVVLAAGRSSRFEQGHKLLASFRGVPLLKATLASLPLIEGAIRLAVTGFRASETGQIARDAGYEPIENPHFAEGLASSIRTGICHVPGQCEAAFLHLGDMPLVQPATFRALIEAAKHNPFSAAFVPAFAGQLGNPVLVRRVLFSELVALEGDQGARALLRRRSDVRLVPVDDAGILVDLDTRAAFAEHSGIRRDGPIGGDPS